MTATIDMPAEERELRRWRTECDPEAIARLFAEREWYEADVPDGTTAPHRFYEEWTAYGPDPSDPDDVRSYDDLVSSIVYNVMERSVDFGPQLQALMREPFSESWQMFLQYLVMESGRVGAIYARQVDDAVRTGVGARWAATRDHMTFQQAVTATAALTGLELLPEPEEDEK